MSRRDAPTRVHHSTKAPELEELTSSSPHPSRSDSDPSRVFQPFILLLPLGEGEGGGEKSCLRVEKRKKRGIKERKEEQPKKSRGVSLFPKKNFFLFHLWWSKRVESLQHSRPGYTIVLLCTVHLPVLLKLPEKKKKKKILECDDIFVF